MTFAMRFVGILEMIQCAHYGYCFEILLTDNYTLITFLCVFTIVMSHKYHETEICCEYVGSFLWRE